MDNKPSNGGTKHLGRVDKVWQPLPQPTSGRIRASHDGYIYHRSRGPDGKGYEICIECGRAGETGKDALKDH